MRRYLTDIHLAERFGVDRSTVWRWSTVGKLPKPVRLGNRTTRWLLEDIERAESELGVKPRASEANDADPLARTRKNHRADERTLGATLPIDHSKILDELIHMQVADHIHRIEASLHTCRTLYYRVRDDNLKARIAKELGRVARTIALSLHAGEKTTQGVNHGTYL